MSSMAPEFVVPAVATTQNGLRPAARSSRIALLQSFDIKLDAIGDGDAAQRLAAEAQQSDGFVERVVGFFGGVNDRLRADGRDSVFDRRREVMRERQGEAAEVGFVASAGESAVEGLLPAKALADPAHGFGLDLGGQLRARHSGELRVERGDEGFGENSSVSGRWDSSGRSSWRRERESPGRSAASAVSRRNRESESSVGGLSRARRFQATSRGAVRRCVAPREVAPRAWAATRNRVDYVDEFVAERTASRGIKSKIRGRHLRL